MTRPLRVPFVVVGALLAFLTLVSAVLVPVALTTTRVSEFRQQAENIGLRNVQVYLGSVLTERVVFSAVSPNGFVVSGEAVELDRDRWDISYRVVR